MHVKFSGQQVWSWVGKIATVIGLVWGSIQILTFATSHDAEIIATGKCNELYLPPPIEERLSHIRKFSNVTDLQTFFPLPHHLQYSAAKHLASVIDVVGSPDTPSHYYFFSISNIGNKEASDLKLELPAKGYCKISKAGEPDTVGYFDRNIAIGKLRAANEIKIVAWSDTDLAYQEKDTRITSPSTVYPVRFQKPFSGLRAAVADNLGFICFVILLVGGAIIFTIFMAKTIKNER